MGKSLKTTIAGIVTGVITLLATFEIVIPEEYTGAIIAVGFIVISYLTKDKDED